MFEAASAPPEKRILGIGASPRPGGNSDAMLKSLLQGAEEQGTPTRTIFLRDIIYSSCAGCEKCRKDKICTRFIDGMTAIYPDILRARGLVLACPTHNYNITALLKAFIDRLYCFYDFTTDHPRGWSSRLGRAGRKIALLGVCEQTDPKDMGATMEMMRLPMTALGYEVVGEIKAYGIFHAGKAARDEELMRKAAGLGRELAAALG